MPESKIVKAPQAFS